MRRTMMCLTAIAAIPAVASAQLVNLGPGSFTPLASVITFDNYGEFNPQYNFFGLPGLGDVTVSFAGAFVGQTVSGGSVRTLTGTPTPGSPLVLNTSVQTYVVGDGANPTSPVLSGIPIFNGPISVLFSTPVAAVGLDGGYFDAIGGTSITAYDGLGNVLGSIVNSSLGIEFFGLATASGLNEIAGISFYITGNEPAGFAIDNLTFGSARTLTPVPEPSALLLVASGFMALAWVGFRRRVNS